MRFLSLSHSLRYFYIINTILYLFISCFKVDLNYPPHLHSMHSDFPLAPERMEIAEESLSPYTRLLRAQLGIKPTTSSPTKLVANLRAKSRYILHHEILKLYLRLGLELVRIHRCVSFTQSSFLKEYIALNNKCRKKRVTPSM